MLDTVSHNLDECSANTRRSVVRTVLGTSCQVGGGVAGKVRADDVEATADEVCELLVVRCDCDVFGVVGRAGWRALCRGGEGQGKEGSDCGGDMHDCDCYLEVSWTVVRGGEGVQGCTPVVDIASSNR